MNQIDEVQKYGIAKFLSKNNLAGLDEDLLYVNKKNIEWRNSVSQQGRFELTKMIKEITEFTQSLQRDLQCIDVKYINDDGELEKYIDTVIQSFKEKINFVKESDNILTKYFSRISKVESLLYLYIDALSEHKEKLGRIQREKDVWKTRVKYIGIPNFSKI